MRKPSIAIVPIVLAMLALPATSQAGLPKAKTNLITVPKSIAGIKSGLKFSKAKKQWGNGECNGDPDDFANCSYTSNDPTEGNASFSSAKGKVANVSINAGLNQKSKYVIAGPLVKFETKEGIGLLDKISKFKRAYPKAKKLGAGYTVQGKGKSYMYVTAIDGKHINAFTLYDGKPRG